MKLSFSVHEEFLAELRQDGPPSRIVRLTASYVAAKNGAPIQYAFVIAGYVNVRGELVELGQFVGDHWGAGFAATKECEARKGNVMDTIRQAAEELGFAVRAGRLEDHNPPLVGEG